MEERRGEGENGRVDYLGTQALEGSLKYSYESDAVSSESRTTRTQPKW